MTRNMQAEIEEAEAHLAHLRRLQAAGNCAENGHEMAFAGGANCGCFDGSCCSVEVYVCIHCGECDYGDSPSANEQRLQCVERQLFEAEKAAGEERRDA